MIGGPAFALATDLDGTFTAGTPAARAELYGALAGHARATLIYITGRSAASVRELIVREGLPVPAVTVSDVGTSVLAGAGPAHLGAIEEAIAASWPGEAAVRARLADIAGLEPQAVHAPRRVSYWIAENRDRRAPANGGDDFEARAADDPSFSTAADAAAAAITLRARAALADLDVDTLVSGNVYLDVLPRGVNKGSTLQRVLTELRIAVTDCVVAGDSLNDRALFDIGARGIVVGNCEPALRAALSGRDDVYIAQQAGAAGLLEGLRRLGLVAGSNWKGGQHAE